MAFTAPSENEFKTDGQLLMQRQWENEYGGVTDKIAALAEHLKSLGFTTRITRSSEVPISKLIAYKLETHTWPSFFAHVTEMGAIGKRFGINLRSVRPNPVVHADVK
jgi:hypothetical protein